jgi:hypothetical protein
MNYCGNDLSQESTMPRASFETVDEEDVEIDSEDVVQLGLGDEEGTTLIELEDGTEVVVVATQLEVAADLGLDPLEFVSPEDDDESLEDLVDEASGEDE